MWNDRFFRAELASRAATWMKADRLLERKLRSRFADFISRRGGRMATLMETISTMRSRGWTAFAFGGIPRGVFENGRKYRPRDFDLVFDDEHFSSFESAFEHYIVRHNSYGGLRLNVKGLAIDAWPLSKTWAFREGWRGEPSFQKLPSTTFLNVDGIVVEVTPSKGKQRRVYENGFFQGWKEKTLDINLQANPYPSICVVRTLRMSKEFEFCLSRRLAYYVWEMLNRIAMPVFQRAQLNHYGVVDFDSVALRAIQKKLEKYLEGGSLFPMTPFPVRPEQLEFGSSKYPKGRLTEVVLHEANNSMEESSVLSDTQYFEESAFIEGLYRQVFRSEVVSC